MRPSAKSDKLKKADASPITGTSDERNESWRGHWRPDGSWAETGSDGDYLDAPSGSVTRFVRRLVWLRRCSADFSPRDAAVLAESCSRGGAFPSRSSWCDQPDGSDLDGWWTSVHAATSAEAAVKYSGQGAYADLWGRARGPQSAITTGRTCSYKQVSA